MSRYVVGVDVGLRSLGLAALEVDKSGFPLSILNSTVVIHDAGIDPDKAKSNETRRASSGVARRAVRRQRTERVRLAALDVLLRANGYPAKDHKNVDPWAVRARLAAEHVDDDAERCRLMSIAIRHIARHRGWRSPYQSLAGLKRIDTPSDLLEALRRAVDATLPSPTPDGYLTPGQLGFVALAHGAAGGGPNGRRLRTGDDKRLSGSERRVQGVLAGKLHQSDYVNELRTIFRTQRLAEKLLDEVLDAVFWMKPPRAAAAERAGKCALEDGEPRAHAASDAFQRFRIASTVANLRRKDGAGERRLSAEERRRAVHFLLEADRDTTWADVTEQLEMRRSDLVGVGREGRDGELVSAKPPVHATDAAVAATKQKKLIYWWKEAASELRDVFITAVRDGVELDHLGSSSAAGAEIVGLLVGLGDDIAVLDDKTTFPAPSGRCAYSLKALSKLTEQMLGSEDDLHDARKAVYPDKVTDDWRPPVDALGAPVGNPSVDRVLKQFDRWLGQVERAYGKPERVTVEHVREGFVSLKVKSAQDFERNRRRNANDRARQRYGLPEGASRQDLRKYHAFQRQHCCCAYCGNAVTFDSAQMDHIVPQATAGSTNRASNLVLTCERCNHAKGKLPFVVWAESTSIPGVSVEEAKDRIWLWDNVQSLPTRVWANFRREVQAQLSKDHNDESLDGRSIESVAWMAREVRARLVGRYGSSANVAVYPGSITAEARRSCGVDRMVQLIRYPSKEEQRPRKNRLDRRHHAVDAAVVALLEPSVARTLAERGAIRTMEQDLGEITGAWKNHVGSGPAAIAKFALWQKATGSLIDLLNAAIAKDAIVVMRNKRLRLSRGRVHEDSVLPLTRVLLGDALSAAQIDAAATPQLWTALTGLPDYDPKLGLPSHAQRRIAVTGRHHAGTYEASDLIPLFGTPSAAVAVRGGYAMLGDSVHHARVYRVTTKLKSGRTKTEIVMLRVFALDLVGSKERDLFTVPLPQNSISMRSAVGTLRGALGEGAAEYLGWIVDGDEVVIEPARFSSSGKIGAFMSAFPGTSRWIVAGFKTADKLSVRPSQLAGEGLPDEVNAAVREVVESRWIVAVNVLFGGGRVDVVRRTALGKPRTRSQGGLPASWSVLPG